MHANHICEFICINVQCVQPIQTQDFQTRLNAIKCCQLDRFNFYFGSHFWYFPCHVIIASVLRSRLHLSGLEKYHCVFFASSLSWIGNRTNLTIDVEQKSQNTIDSNTNENCLPYSIHSSIRWCCFSLLFSINICTVDIPFGHWTNKTNWTLHQLNI